MKEEPTKINLPKPKKIDGKIVPQTISFENFNRQLPVPFTIYADFESVVEKIDTVTQSKDRSYTEKTHKNTPCGYAYIVVCHYDKKYSKQIVQ